MKNLDLVASLFILAGGLNWGMLGFSGDDLIAYIFADGLVLQVVYILIGFSTLYKFIRGMNRAFLTASS